MLRILEEMKHMTYKDVMKISEAAKVILAQKVVETPSINSFCIYISRQKTRMIVQETDVENNENDESDITAMPSQMSDDF